MHLLDSTSKHIPSGGSLICFYDLPVRAGAITTLDKLFFRGFLLILFFMQSWETITHKFGLMLSHY